jgi:crotonobetainyl-CoA:carnitine CoA-transferase CaiB-like acyl-CoA transferase
VVSKPLSGLRVLDLTLARAGPVAVRLLADWGADVIRVEPPSSTQAQDVTGHRAGSDAQNLHRNKRSLSLNLKTEVGYGLFLKLLATADILVENFRAEVKYRLKIDYETLRQTHPSLIYASISGFGQDGPYRDRPGVDQIVQGTSGLMSLTGELSGPPMRVGIAISDTSAGMFLGQGILLALIERSKTGVGQWVHTSLLEAMLSKLDFQAARYTMSGESPGRVGNHHPTFSPMGVFEAADGFVNIAASTTKMFRAFCDVLSVPQLAADARFESGAGRLKHRDALNATINECTRALTMQQLVEQLNDVGCPCGPIYSVAEAFDDPQAQHLGMVANAHHDALGDIGLIRSPINLSNHAPVTEFDRAAPALGAHNQEIYTELGLSDLEIQALERAGAV